MAVPRVITAGETMLLGGPARPGLLRHAKPWSSGSGAESNVAIALSRRGVPSGWASFLGEDEAGQLVRYAFSSTATNLFEYSAGRFVRKMRLAEIPSSRALPREPGASRQGRAGEGRTGGTTPLLL
jgi:hypothetical protein